MVRCAVDEYGPNSRLSGYHRCTVILIAGAKDWGIYQFPGNFEKMQTTACKRMLSVHLVENAGHWVQQEQATATTRLLLEFLQQANEHRAG